MSIVRSAYHEAGHAVVGVRLGFQSLDCYLVRPWYSATLMKKLRPRQSSKEPSDPKEVFGTTWHAPWGISREAKVLLGLAGMGAELRRFPGRLDIWGFYACAYLSEGLESPDHEMGSELEWAIPQVEMMIHDPLNWKAICRVAHLLICRSGKRSAFEKKVWTADVSQNLWRVYRDLNPALRNCGPCDFRYRVGPHYGVEGTGPQNQQVSCPTLKEARSLYREIPPATGLGSVLLADNKTGKVLQKTWKEITPAGAVKTG